MEVPLYFYLAYKDLDRLSPGSDETTLKALDKVDLDTQTELNILDIACGVGTSTILLANHFENSTVEGFDLFRHYVDKLDEKIIENNLSERVFSYSMDMNDPDFANEEFDIVFCEAAIVIIPGTRNSTEDMYALRESGLAERIIEKSAEIPIVGICGGLQILGNVIHDEDKRESKHGTIEGLGLLDIESSFSREGKIVTQSIATIPDDLDGIAGEMFKNIVGEEVSGYEIHEGTSELLDSTPLLNICKGQGNNDDGKIDGASNGNAFATYFHGIFHNYNFRREFLNYIRVKKGLDAKYGEDPYETQKDYSLNRLAEIVEEHLDMDIIDKLLFNE